MFAIHEADFDGFVRLEGEVAVVAISGDVDIANIDLFAALLVAAESLKPGTVVVSLENAFYFSARAVGMLAAWGVRLKERRGCGFAVVCPREHVLRRVLSILEFPHAVLDQRELHISV